MDAIMFSVIIPVYYAAEYIRQSMESVIKQNFQDYEIIVVDNGTPDNSIQIVQDIIQENPDKNIRIISLPENKGISGGRNAGINSAVGQYVCFLDADDFWYSDKLSEVYNLIVLHSDSDVIWHWEHHIKNGEKKLVRYRELPSADVYIDLLKNSNCLSTSAVTVKTLAIRSVGGFDETLTSGEEDYDCWLRLARDGCKFSLIQKPLGVFVIHGESTSSKSEKHLLAIMAMVEKHYMYVNDNADKFRLSQKLNWKKKKAAILCSCGRRLSLSGKRSDANKYYIESVKNDAAYLKAYAGMVMNLFHI